MPEILTLNVYIKILGAISFDSNGDRDYILTAGTLGLSNHSYRPWQKIGKKKQNCLNKLTFFNKMHYSNLFV